MNDLTKNPGCCIYKHGGFGTKEYRTWQGLKNRCNNPKSPYYPKYGGIGIKVCERWVNSFENFLEDMGNAPSPTHSIDRYPNRQGDYEPNNCRWATPTEQSNNRDCCVMVTHNGETMNFTAWSKKLGIEVFHFVNAKKRGKSLEQVIAKHMDENYDPKDWEIEKPYDSSIGLHAEYNGTTMSLKTWASVLGIQYKYLHKLIRVKKLTIHQILSNG